MRRRPRRRRLGPAPPGLGEEYYAEEKEKAERLMLYFDRLSPADRELMRAAGNSATAIGLKQQGILSFEEAEQRLAEVSLQILEAKARAIIAVPEPPPPGKRLKRTRRK